MKKKIHLTTGIILLICLIGYVVEIPRITIYQASSQLMAIYWLTMIVIAPVYLFTGEWGE